MKIIQIAAGAEGELYALTDEGVVLQRTAIRGPFGLCNYAWEPLKDEDPRSCASIVAARISHTTFMRPEDTKSLEICLKRLGKVEKVELGFTVESHDAKVEVLINKDTLKISCAKETINLVYSRGTYVRA